MRYYDNIIAKVELELKKAKTQLADTEGLLRLQEVMGQYEGEDKLISSIDLLKEISSREEVKSNPTKIKDLDDLIGGFQLQQLVTVSAHSKHGKTAFGLHLMNNMFELSPVMIPLEQSNEELVLQRSKNKQTIPLFYSPTKLPPKVSLDWIEHRIVEGIAKYSTRLVVIDHLGYINNMGPDNINQRENLAYRIGEVMRGLKFIAKKWKVVMVLLVHISQGNEGRPPVLEDIKNSSDILQESDLVMMLWRVNKKEKGLRVYEDKTLLSVLANRQTGKNGNIGLTFDSKTGHFQSGHDWLKDMADITNIGNDDY